MNSKHLFFDLDHTLWDFEKNSEIALTQLYDDLQLHLKINSFKDFHKVYKRNNSILWQQYGKGKIKKEELREKRFKNTLKHFDLNDPILVEQLSQGYIDLSPQQTCLFPKTLETLEYLQKEGYNMHIITNGFKEVQFVKLNKSGLEKYFDVIVCYEDVGKNKPSREIFSHSMKRAGCTSDHSVMIGDDYEVDILGAMRSGMQGVLFDPKNHFRHYEKNFRIKHLGELPEILPWVFRKTL